MLLSQEVVNGYQARVASQGQTKQSRQPGGRGGGKRGGKVHCSAPNALRMDAMRFKLFFSASPRVILYESFLFQASVAAAPFIAAVGFRTVS